MDLGLKDALRLFGIGVLTLAACGGGNDDDDDDCGAVEGECIVVEPGEDDQQAIQAALLAAQPGDVVFFKEGVYHLDGDLSLDTESVTIRGEGMDKSVLSFAGQESGAQGLLVTGDDFLMEDIGLEDMLGDGVKTLGIDGVTWRRTRVEWTGGPQLSNGPYAVYPVQSKNILIEECVMRGASDVGVYVGQSDNIIVRNNLAEENVSGIELENSTNGDVYGNTCRNNTSGMLMLDLPNLQVKNGHTIRVYDNEVVDNNLENFGDPATIAGFIPKGIGLLLLASNNIEVFDNRFENNQTLSVGVISYKTVADLGGFTLTDMEYEPYPETINVHDNEFVSGGEDPQGVVGTVIKNFTGTPIPHVMYDGDFNKTTYPEGLPSGKRICAHDNTNASYVNLDVANNFANLSTDPAEADCTHPALPKVNISGVE